MLNKNLVLMVLVVFAAGCGLETRTYVMTKPRVGLDQNNGNAGCVVGKCPPAPAPKELTRKIYVLEVTKPVPESEVKKIEQTTVTTNTETVEAPPVSNNAHVQSAPAESAPAASNNPQPAAPSQEAVSQPTVQNNANMQEQTYTVQKDDTLQKISKKLFGTYSKWYKIYSANKDKIKNPNVLKPGTVLTIPAVK
jgi:nucleoid-associated protein YgaU